MSVNPVSFCDDDRRAYLALVAKQDVKHDLTFCQAALNSIRVIRSYRSKALKLFANKGDAAKLPVPDSTRVARQLALLNAAVRPEDLDLPGFRFHGLQGKPKRYSIRVTANYRITFGWEPPDAMDVDLEDYHA